MKIPRERERERKIQPKTFLWSNIPHSLPQIYRYRSIARLFGIHSFAGHRVCNTAEREREIIIKKREVALGGRRSLLLPYLR